MTTSFAELKNTQPRLWIVEDDDALRDVYSEILSNLYQLTFFPTLGEFKTQSMKTKNACDLLIADLRLSDGNFLDFLSAPDAHLIVRSPFMVISSQDQLDTLRQCFNEGALDYLSKPFTAAELVVKVERLIGRTRPKKDGADSECIELDASKLRVKYGTEAIRLTAKELQIFSLLHESQGSPVPRKRLQSEVWGEAKVSHKSLDVHIFHLRRKLGKLGLTIECDLSGGFRLKEPEALSP